MNPFGLVEERVESRLAAWWSAWKYVAILLLLFVLSAILNVRQWADHRAYVKSQDAELRAAANEAGLKVTAAIAVQKQKDDPKLIEAVGRIEKRVNALKNTNRPPPLPVQCAPGQQRMDAVNAGADR